MTTRGVQVLINVWLCNDRFYAEIDDVTVQFVHENIIKLPKMAMPVYRLRLSRCCLFPHNLLYQNKNISWSPSIYNDSNMSLRCFPIVHLSLSLKIKKIGKNNSSPCLNDNKYMATMKYFLNIHLQYMFMYFLSLKTTQKMWSANCFLQVSVGLMVQEPEVLQFLDVCTCSMHLIQICSAFLQKRMYIHVLTSERSRKHFWFE